MVDESERELLRAVLRHVLENNAFPSVDGFRRRHRFEEARLADLVERGLLKVIEKRYYPTLLGLRACASEEAEALIAECKAMLPGLQRIWRHEHDSVGTSKIDALRGPTGSQVLDVEVLLAFLVASGLVKAYGFSPSGLPDRLVDLEGVIYVDDFDALLAAPQAAAPAVDFTGIALRHLDTSGYRPFAEFSAELGDLTVIIGANAAGKSSLFDFLRLLAFAAQTPLPPEIDPRCAGKLVFHTGGEDRLSFAITATRSAAEPLRYEAEILGPIGAPKVARERLILERHGEAADPLTLLDFRAGRGSLRDRDPASQAPWTVPSNELALRRALAPNLPTLSGFQGYLASWRFYPGFDVGSNAAVRRPAHVEENPVLAEDGANLSAVLSWLKLEHPEAWDELESHLRATLPGFVSLGVKPRGKGMTIGVLREAGLPEELTLADLSDGTLRLLCWLALAVSPSLSPLVCLDEPEIGLHPRVLPTLAGALKLASARSQILIATHSPHFLSQFALEDIAVMRKENGRAVFVRPATSEALRREVAEIGGEALAKLFLSEELEVLP